MKPRHLLFATVGDAFSVHDWSGITYRMREALERRFDRVTVVSRLPTTRAAVDVAKRLILGEVRYPLWVTDSSLRSFGRKLRLAVEQAQPDVVLSVSSHCLVQLGAVGCGTFMTTDTPWASYMETYAEWDPMPLKGPAFIRSEAAAARQLDGVIVASDWARDEAVRRYGIAPEAAAAIPYGANFASPPSTEMFEQSLAKRPVGRLELLYLGKDWDRKGGNLAVECVVRLREMGVNAILHIVGAQPDLPPHAQSACVVHGFLRKDDPEESRLLLRLLSESHVLLVPTRAEGYGIVFAEAAAYGMPVVARHIHSLPTIVRDGETGLLLPDGASAADYAERIAAAFTDRARYEAMAVASRHRYESTLNWDAFTADAQAFMAERMARRQASTRTRVMFGKDEALSPPTQ